MKRIVKTRNILFAAVIMLAASGGCKLSEKTYSAANYVVPADFKGRADSVSAVTMTFDQFFADKMLVALIDSALLSNADLLISLQRVEAAKANLLQSRGALYPSLNLQASGGAVRFGDYTMDGRGNATTPGVPYPVTPDYLVGVTSSWEVDVWGKLKNKKKAAQLRYLATDAGRNFLVTNLVAEVAYRYYTLAALDEELDIIGKNIKLQEAALGVVKLQKEVGRATELAVKQFEAQLARTQGMEYRVKTDIAITENELNFLLGRYFHRIDRNKLSMAETDKVVRMGVPAQLLRNRPDIVQAELELNATRAEVASARAAFLPAISISVSAGYNAYNTAVLFNPASVAFSFLGALVTPVFNKNTIRANYNLMLAEHKGAYFQYGKTVMNAVYEVSTALERIENQRAEYGYNQRAATALNEAVSISGDQFVAGYANYLEIITAQKSAIEAELEVVQTKRKILFSTIDLYRSLGGK